MEVIYKVQLVQQQILVVACSLVKGHKLEWLMTRILRMIEQNVGFIAHNNVVFQEEVHAHLERSNISITDPYSILILLVGDKMI